MQPHLHELTDVLALGEDLAEVLGAEDVPVSGLLRSKREGIADGEPEGGLGEEARGAVGVLDVRDGDGGVGHAVVDDGVDGDGDGVLGEDLLRRHVERHGAQVDLRVRVRARDDEE